MLRYFRSLLVYQHVDVEYSAQTDTSTVRLEGACRLAVILGFASILGNPMLKSGIILQLDMVIKC